MLAVKRRFSTYGTVDTPLNVSKLNGLLAFNFVLNKKRYSSIIIELLLHYWLIKYKIIILVYK